MERSAKQIGYIDGFYDYAIENTVAEHPDITFKRLENDFRTFVTKSLKMAFVHGSTKRSSFCRTCR